MICVNPQCPDMVKLGLRGEYREGVTSCPKCGAPLSAIPSGPAAEPGKTPDAPVQEGNADESDFATVARFREAHLAHVLEGALVAAGLHPAVLDEHTVSINWLYSNAIGGVRVVVPASEAEAAAEILDSEGLALDENEAT